MSSAGGQLTTIRVIPNSQCKEFTTPNLTDKCLIPCKLVVEVNEGTRDDPELAEPNNIVVRISSGGVNLVTNSEPYFQYSNVIDLRPYIGIIEQHGVVAVSLQNKSGDRGEFHVHVTYEHSEGATIFEERMVQFGDVFQKISKARSQCNTLLIQFDKPITELELEPTFKATGESDDAVSRAWVRPSYNLISHYMRVNNFSSQQIADFTALPSETPVILDFLNDPQLAQYKTMFHNLQLKAVTIDQTIATAYVLGAGFPKDAKRTS